MRIRRPNGTGDTLQDTTSGLAFWRKSTNTPTFTNGDTHWALTPTGFISWTGSSIDPPGGAAAPPAGVTPDRPFGPRTRDTDCMARGGRPDGACTPGAIIPDVTSDQVCRPGYSSSVRNVPAELSREVYAAYGVVERTAGEYEVDHLVPLEIGGSNDIANLWPQAAAPPPGWHEKDRVENYLHEQVCAGRMALFDAQRAVAADWVAVYEQLPSSGATVPAKPTVAPAETATPTPTPNQPPSGQGSVQLVSVNGSAPGGRASVTAQTTPGASCSIVYTTPAGSRSAAQGLSNMAANSSGSVSWTWDIGPSTRPGDGSVVVTCDGVSARGVLHIG
ncbi:MAG: HNH endonuclease [Chloroflexi bacterium]|nr:HNH endonuclease [Chloroflexota bacterium]